MTESLLEVTGLLKRFGGLLATDNLDLDVSEGEIHAVIGPNGAGKTTLIGQLAGEIAPDGGRITFDGRNITSLPPHRRSRLGLARSFQITSIFLNLTATDNVALAVQAHDGHSFRFWRPARAERALRDPALAILEEVGLQRRADEVTANLSHGEQRQLELAMALATKPKMLLLDEPTAGMGRDESTRMIEILRSLRGNQTILLIEHDMDVVFALADRVTVLVYGQVIASGSPDQIRADPAVREAYLGEEESTAATS